MLAPINVRPTTSYELQQDRAWRGDESRSRSSYGPRRSLSPPRGYHNVSRRHRSSGGGSASGLLSPMELGARSRGGRSFNFDERAPLPTGTPDGQNVSRRYFFRGLVHEGTGFPAAGHYDVIVPHAAQSRSSVTVSRPLPDADASDQRRSFDYVDTLVSAVSTPSNGESSGTVLIRAEDLARFVADSRPFAAPDSRPMFLLARDLLKSIVSDKLELVSRQGEELQAAISALQEQRAALESQLSDQTNGITAKLRRVEARLEAERAAAESVRAERDALAKEAERATRRLRRYEPEEHGGLNALRRTKTLLGGMQNYILTSSDAAEQRRERMLGDPALLHSSSALIEVLSQADRWQLLRQVWHSFGLPEITMQHVQAVVADGNTPHDAGTKVDLKLFVRSKTGAQKREIIDDLGAKLQLNDETLQRLIEPYPTLLGGSAEQVALMRSLGNGISANAVVRCLQDGAVGNGQPMANTVVGVLSLFYRLPGNLTTEKMEYVRAASEFGLCVGEERRRQVLEQLRGAPLPEPLPQEPDQLSPVEQQLLLAQLLTQHDIEADEYISAAACAAEKGGTDRLPPPVLALLDHGNVGGENRINSSESRLATVVRSGMNRNHPRKLVIASTQTEPCDTNGGGFESTMERLCEGDMSTEDARSLGAAFLKHADAYQLRELLEDSMADERASGMIKAIVSEHELQARITRTAKNRQHMKNVATRSSAFGIGSTTVGHQEEECELAQAGVVNAQPVGVSITKKAALAASISSAFAAAHTKRKTDRVHNNLQGIRRLTSNATNVKRLQQVYADAHARDFTPKEWLKRTKNLTGAALFAELWPPVPGFPCEKAMKLSSMNKLVSKIYEQFCSEFYAGVHRTSRVGERSRPSLVEHVEDSLLLQYGMPSLARKTLLQMVATCHKHYEQQARCRTFAELSQIIPPRWDMISLCPNEAQDFYFRSLVAIFPSARKGKLADNMCSVRTSSLGIEDAYNYLRTLYPPGMDELELEMREDLAGLCHETKKGDIVVGIDEYLDYMLSKWCSMADAQQQQLVALFGTVDDGDGQLSLTEFMHVVEEVTPAASQAEVLELYKCCLARSAEIRAGVQDEEEEDTEATTRDSRSDMDAIELDAFLAVMLPHLLQTIQNIDGEGIAHA